MKSSDLVFVGIRGSVVALDGDSGESVWVAQLKGTEFVNVVLEGQQLLAATYGELFCLDAATGRVIWHNRLKGYGTGLATIATAGATASSPALVIAEKRRRDQQTAAAGGAVAAAAG